MLTEYRGYVIDGRDDFKIQEVGDNLTLFMFNPKYFEVDGERLEAFENAMLRETNGSFTLITTELIRGIITLIINPTVAHLYTKERVVDAFTKFIFDCRIDDDENELLD